MKNVKKLAALVLALALVLSMMITVSAETANEAPGSITINGVREGMTYEIYRLLDLESYDTDSGAYSYKVDSDWEGFFATQEALYYVNIDDAGYVRWNEGKDGESDVAEFAKKALAYAKTNGINPMQSSENEGEFVITDAAGKFSNLPLGYYLVDSTAGALCGLTTTNPDASVNAKNGQPTVEKQVVEDLTGQYGHTNTADIGQTVEFRTTIHVHAGAENYVLHDTMSKGLTFLKITSVEHVLSAGGSHPVADTEYTLKNNADDDETNDCVDNDCTFEIVFTEDFCEHLGTNDAIIIKYTAMLNRDAIIASNGNPNETWLDYGEGNHTTHDSTTTYSFGIDIVKTDSQNTKIDGAKFRIYDAATEGNEVAVVPLMKSDVDDSIEAGSDDDVQVGYRRARADEEGVEIVVKDGQVRIVGFDNGTYYLEETEAPEGYNKLTSRQQFIIADANLDAVFNGNVFSSGSGVHVVNKTGTMLPETGGMGTTLFYAVGGMLVAAAVVLLITRKRMSEN